MARIGSTARPPIFSALGLMAFALLLGPHPVGAIEPEPMGPRPHCIVQGERHGELYTPDAAWKSQMPVVKPHGHWNMPILPGDHGVDGDVFDVDDLVSGLKRLLATPKS